VVLEFVRDQGSYGATDEEIREATGLKGDTARALRAPRRRLGHRQWPAATHEQWEASGGVDRERFVSSRGEDMNRQLRLPLALALDPAPGSARSDPSMVRTEPAGAYLVVPIGGRLAVVAMGKAESTSKTEGDQLT